MVSLKIGKFVDFRTTNALYKGTRVGSGAQAAQRRPPPLPKGPLAHRGLTAPATRSKLSLTAPRTTDDIISNRQIVKKRILFLS